jgi:hypothetical protein
MISVRLKSNLCFLGMDVYCCSSIIGSSMIGWPSMQITFSLNFSLFSLMLTGQSNWNLVHVTT